MSHPESDARASGKWFSIFFVVFAALLGLHCLAALLSNIFEAFHLVTTRLPLLHIETWSERFFTRIDQGKPIYGPMREYASPIYQWMPFYLNYLMLRILGVTHFDSPEVLIKARIANFVWFGLAWVALTAMFLRAPRGFSRSWVPTLAAPWIAVMAALAMRPFWHLFFSFPHEVTKFCILAFWLVYLPIFLEKERPSRARLTAITVFACALPLVRQTWIPLSLVAIATSLQIEWKASGSKSTAFRRLALTSALGLATLGLITLLYNLWSGGSYFAWALELPKHHPRKLVNIPVALRKILKNTWIVGAVSATLMAWAGALFRVRALLVSMGAATLLTLIHASKQGSGSHMADTVIFAVIILLGAACMSGALAIPIRKRVLLLSVGVLGFAALFRLTSDYSLWPNPSLYASLPVSYRAIEPKRLELEGRIARLAARIRSLPINGDGLSLVSSVDFPGFRFDGPLITSITETQYARPPQDTQVLPLLQDRGGGYPTAILTFYAEALLPYFPKDIQSCIKTETGIELLQPLQLMIFECGDRHARMPSSPSMRLPKELDGFETEPELPGIG